MLGLLIAGCAPSTSRIPNSAGSTTEGKWTQFYAVETDRERLNYFYDAKRVHRNGDHIVSRWKVVGATSSGTTLYVIDIACRNGTFTEKNTVLIDAQGQARELPQSDLLVDHPIETGRSSDAFSKIHCR